MDQQQGDVALTDKIIRVRSADEIEAVGNLVWEFFDSLKQRYPEMHDNIDTYIEVQDIAGGLMNFGKFFYPRMVKAFWPTATVNPSVSFY